MIKKNNEPYLKVGNSIRYYNMKKVEEKEKQPEQKKETTTKTGFCAKLFAFVLFWILVGQVSLINYYRESKKPLPYAPPPVLLRLDNISAKHIIHD